MAYQLILAKFMVDPITKINPISFCLLILIAFGVCTPSDAQTNASSRLGQGNYRQRHQATLELWRQRNESREEVQRAARNADPEIAGRAKWILRRWQRGVVPGMPEHISRLLQSDDPSAIDRLLDYGQFKAAAIAVSESVGTVNLEVVQDRVTRALVRRFPVYVSLAVQNETLDDLLHLIDLSATSPEMALCRVQLMRLLGEPINEADLLPRSAQTWTNSLQQQTQVLLLYHLGRNELATQDARTFGDQAMLISTLLLNRQWDELAQLHLQAVMNSDPETLEYSRLWSEVLIAADRADNQELVQRAVRALVQAGQESGGGPAAAYRWRALAMHGFLDEALSLLGDDPSTATELAVASDRLADGLEILGYDLREIDSKLDEWIEQAMQSQVSAQGSLATDFARILGLMRVLLRLEDEEHAWRIASQICERGRRVDPVYRSSVLMYLSLATKNDWIVDLAVYDDERSLSSSVDYYVVRALPDCDGPTLNVMLDAMGYVMPGQTFPNRFRATASLFRGELPEAFGDTRAEKNRKFRQLFDRLAYRRRVQRAAGRVVIDSTPQVNENIVKLLRRHDQMELALEGLRVMASNGNASAHLRLAEHEMLHGQAVDAIEQLDRVEEMVRGNQQVAVANGDLAAKSLVLRWLIARRQGDTELASDLLRRLNLALCSPSSEMRSSVAEYLAERGETELAREVFEGLLPMSVYGSMEVIDLYSAALTYSLAFEESDPGTAADVFDLAITTMLEWSINARRSAYIVYPSFVGVWAVEDAIAKGNTAQAQRYGERVLSLRPLNIDFAERVLPKMRESGMSDLANQFFNRVFERGLMHTQQFPWDATMHNNVAWAGAMNQSRLDESWELSQHACYVEPESAVFRDTLAELMYQRGDVAQALALQEQCLLDAPDDWHFHEQVLKYRAELREAE